MIRSIAVLFILSALAGLPVHAQSEVPHSVRSEGHLSPARTKSDITLAEALRAVAGRDGAKKGRKLLAWVRQRAEKLAKVTHH